MIQEGDRIVAINGVELIGVNLRDCKAMLDRSSSKCSLTVKFDVAGK